ncbi:MAG: threonine synthase [Cellulosilyticaceae bacterium]
MKLYTSTRGKGVTVTPTKAILKGIAEDGGLFIPDEIPRIDFELVDLVGQSYQAVAYEIMKLFLNELTEEELKTCINQAYDNKFDTAQIAPIRVTQKGYFLELFHGPTLAFKDMALTILPYLMSISSKKQTTEQEIVILTATSGDTGKAALEGFANIPGTRIVVFFPEEGVSEIQKRQMITQQGNNVLVVGIKGNFDQAQAGVKEILGDHELRDYIAQRGYKFSSANSINIGRLIPQIVYYFYAYSQLVEQKRIKIGEVINVAVPTGNFGNILAAYYAKQMGLPIKQLICASNKNKVLFDFFKQGVYDINREFYTTNSPSMDILVSSNLERLLYYLADQNTETINQLMKTLKKEGRYTITPQMQEKIQDFYGGFTNEKETQNAIKKIYQEEGYLIDPHTAVAYAAYEKYLEETGDDIPVIIVATASPYKFTKSVMGSLDEQYEVQNDFDLLEEMEKIIGMPMPKGVSTLKDKPIKHTTQCEVYEMKKIIKEFLS